MTGFRRWLGKWFGLQADVQDQVVEDLGVAVKVGGAMGRFEWSKEAAEFASDLAVNHPDLAQLFREQVAGMLGLPTAVPAPAALDQPPAPVPPALPEAAPKKTPGRPKKAAAEPGTDPTGTP
jgi:hypothetical protein